MSAAVLTLACRNETELTAIIDRARAADGARVVDVRSSAPLSHDLAEQVPSRPSRVPVYGMLGGVLGGLVAYLVAMVAAQAYPMITGHMPILAAPPMGIITYEGIALGAVLATTIGVLIECRLPKLSSGGEAAARVAQGELVVSLEVPAERVDEFGDLGETIDG